MKLIKSLVGAAMLCIAAPVFGQETAAPVADDAPGLYVIYDSSNSMWGELADESRKYESARHAISEFLTGDFGNQVLALRVYGAQNANDCQDSALVVPFQSPSSASPLIDAAVSSSRPTGRTPIHLSLLRALEDFGDRSGRILLISDGIESCGADPCALLQEWREHNVSIDVHVVGFGLRAEERPALVCMSNAAGTPFVEASSAGELAAALVAVQTAELNSTSETETSTPEMTQAYSRPVLRLNLTNSDGESLTGVGHATLLDESGAQVEFSEILEIATHSRNAIVPGLVQVSAGVRTLNGDIYHPETSDVEVAPAGETVVNLQVSEPPRVQVILRQDGEVLSPAGLVYAFVEGEEVFHFRARDTVYVDPGTYVFRTSPNDFNQDMMVEITVPELGITNVVFDLAATIRTTVRYFAMPWHERITGVSRFHQNGVEMAGVNATNAVRLAPGTYDYIMDHGSGLIEGTLEITSGTGATVDIEVPTARVVVNYETSSGQADANKRAFITPESNNRRRSRQSGSVFYLIAGTYLLDGWQGNYESVEFEVLGGEDLTLVLRAQE